MKNYRDIDHEHEPICAVWKNSPRDPKNDHTRLLVPVKTSQGEIRVCTKCCQDMNDIVAFQQRKYIAHNQSQMSSIKIEIKTQKEIIESIEKRAGVVRRKRITKLLPEPSSARIQIPNKGEEKVPLPPIKK